MKRTFKRVHDAVTTNFEKQLQETIEIIRLRSVLDEKESTVTHPFGPAMSRSLDDFLERAKKMGFITKNIDNSIGYVEIGNGDKLIGILAHLDVVPEGNPKDWKYPPFSGTIKDDRLYGRGAIDDKGPAMAALYAMKALKESGLPLLCRFRLIIGLDEESGSRCIARYNQTEEQPLFSFSPDSEFPVVNAEKGIIRATVTKTGQKTDHSFHRAEIQSFIGGDRFNVVPDRATVFIKCSDTQKEEIVKISSGFEVTQEDNGLSIAAQGIAAHAMEPGKGVNAVQKLIGHLSILDTWDGESRELLHFIHDLSGDGYDGEILGITMRDDISGMLTCNVAALTIETVGEIKKATLKLDIRYPVTANPDLIIENIGKSVARTGGELTLNTHKKPLYIPESHPVVKILLDSYESVTGSAAKPISIGGGTYCRFMPNAVSAGPLFPGEEELAHQANEYITLPHLLKCTHIYAEALMRFNDM